jgi:hypothetical protein
MSHPDLVPSNEQIMETMIELTRLSKSHRAIVAGSNVARYRAGHVKSPRASSARLPALPMLRQWPTDATDMRNT